MLESLHLRNVGPAPEMHMELAPRLNLITGDNGLGKSFLLDVAWWALTRRWPHDLNSRLTSGYAAEPTNVRQQATIGFRLQSKQTSVEYESVYVPRDQSWLGRAGRPWNPGLVIYAHSDGGFSVWDPHGITGRSAAKSTSKNACRGTSSPPKRFGMGWKWRSTGNQLW